MSYKLQARIDEELYQNILEQIKMGRYKDITHFTVSALLNELGSIDVDQSRLDSLESSVASLNDELTLIKNELQGLVLQLSKVSQ